jgi:VIT1/CCC1 family predicted Fe2+/Mn2+ transporter
MHEITSWSEEMRAAYLYRVVAQAEAGTPREKLFLELAGEAEGQAAIWADKARAAGGTLPEFVPDMRARVVAGLVRSHGPRKLRTVLAAMKVRGMSVYAANSTGHVSPHHVDDKGHHSGMSGGGNLRAAVFGINDGLISNASLIMGVAGASADAATILLTGTAGLVAGAFSMAAGEYVSMRSQREMFEYQIGLERDELAAYPEEEAHELALIYEARGISPEESQRMAQTVITDPERALDALAREELGLNPEDLGSPWGAAIFSFLSFAAGGVVPLLPFVFGAGSTALNIAIGLTAVALFAVGATLSLFTGRNALLSGLRMLAIGAAAGGVTFMVGRLLGVSVA